MLSKHSSNSFPKSCYEWYNYQSPSKRVLELFGNCAQELFGEVLSSIIFESREPMEFRLPNLQNKMTINHFSWRSKESNNTLYYREMYSIRFLTSFLRRRDDVVSDLGSVNLNFSIVALLLFRHRELFEFIFE